MSISLHEIANLVQGSVVGESAISISSLSPIDDIVPGSLVYAEGEDKIKIAESSAAAAILVHEAVEFTGKPLIKVAHPFKAFVRLIEHFNPPKKPTPGVHPTVVLGEGVQLGDNVSIGPYTVIEAGSVIGNNTVIKSHVHIGDSVQIGNDSFINAHVSIYDNCQLGARVIIHSGTVIGSDGFGYRLVDGQHYKIPHCGKVIIEDDVEIGSNTSIDRATMGATVIGQGTKIDNLVQVAHSVKLGKHNILCGFTGIAGSTTTGNYVVFAANVGVSDHVRIDDGVVLAARTGVPPNKHLKEGIVYLGSPARPKEIAIKHELAVNRIPLLRKNIKTLNDKVAELEQRLEKQEA
ncbi:MAG: UDP-3-O-(3-hydroxymyristoyl)glucosamine N-acyltransferase [Legionella sp.]|nr:MAG: UDP-3-O-(3-hydroxymyristoyl)glucosamine N-acyltransferase [Legionella sp.]